MTYMRTTLAAAMLLLGLPCSAQDVDCASAPYRASRSTDAMTDRQRCLVLGRGNGAPFAAFTKETGLVFGVLGDKYPGRGGVGLRAGKTAPHTGDPMVHGEDAMALLEELRSADSISTQYVDWPSGAKSDHTYPTCNFVAEVESCLE